MLIGPNHLPLKTPLEKQVEREHVAVDRLESRYTLVDLSNVFDFYTLGVLYAAGVDRNLLHEFLVANPDASHAIHQLDYAHPFFSGLGKLPTVEGEADLDRSLVLVGKPYSEMFRNFVASAGFVKYSDDPVSPISYFAVVNYRLVDYVDPFAVARQAVVTDLPTVELCIFGLSATDGFYNLNVLPYPALPVYFKSRPDEMLQEQLSAFLAATT